MAFKENILNTESVNNDSVFFCLFSCFLLSCWFCCFLLVLLFGLTFVYKVHCTKLLHRDTERRRKEKKKEEGKDEGKEGENG